jgi:hypothetical protein
MSDKGRILPEQEGSLIGRVSERMAIVTQPFPFDKLETLKIIGKPMVNSWSHPLVSLSQRLLKHHGLDYESEQASASVGHGSGVPRKTASLSFTAHGIFVYSDDKPSYDLDGSFDNLIGFYQYPSYLADKMPRLMELAEHWGNQPPHRLEKPLFPLKRERNQDNDCGFGL